MYVIEERRYLRREAPVEPFDRIAFAMRCLRILAPAMKVAVFEGRFELEIEQGRDFAAGRDKKLALVRIPSHASREHIAVALAQLSGASDAPWVIDTLLRAGDADAA